MRAAGNSFGAVLSFFVFFVFFRVAFAFFSVDFSPPSPSPACCCLVAVAVVVVVLLVSSAAAVVEPGLCLFGRLQRLRRLIGRRRHGRAGPARCESRARGGEGWGSGGGEAEASGRAADQRPWPPFGSPLKQCTRLDGTKEPPAEVLQFKS